MHNKKKILFKYLDCLFIDTPEVTVNDNPDRIVNIRGSFTLDCNYVGFPIPNVTWTLNDTKIDTSSNSYVTIRSLSMSSSMTTTLTWKNVQLEAQGRYYCLIVNNVGSANETYNVILASEFMNVEF